MDQRYRRSLGVLAIVTCGLLSSCSTTPQSKLHGRWYNSAMSIRFRTDGTVIFNSRQGLATGRYFFDGEVRPEASEEPVPNLIMDLQRNGEVYRVTYELLFLGRDRLRIKSASLDEEQSENEVQAVVILKRAENEDVNGVNGLNGVASAG